MFRLIDGNYIYAETNEYITGFSLRIAFIAEVEVFFITFAFMITTIIVVAFLCYHLSLVSRNKTTNETFKWESLRRVCREVQKTSNGKTLLQLFREDSVNNPTVEVPQFDASDFPINIYNNGVFRNAVEVFRPNMFIIKKKKTS